MSGSHAFRDTVRSLILVAKDDETGECVVTLDKSSYTPNKGGGYASDKVSGSHAFRDTVRSLILVAKDDETGECVVTLDKSSYTPQQGQSYKYTLAPRFITDDDGERMEVPIITDDETGECVVTLDKSSYTPQQGQSYKYTLAPRFITDDDGERMEVPIITNFAPTDTNVNEIINRNITGGDTTARAADNEVAEWLTNYLAENGPTNCKQIAADAKDAEGYTFKQLQHARERLTSPRVIARKDPTYTGRGRRSLWEPTDTNVNEIINRNITGGDTTGRTADNEVAEWLTNYLAENGPTNCKQIAADAKDAEGYTFKQLQHARERLTSPRVIARKDPTYTGRGRRSLWELEQPECTSTITPHQHMG